MTTPSWPFPSVADPAWLTPPGPADPYLAAAREAVRSLLPPVEGAAGPQHLRSALTAAREVADRLEWVLLSLVGEARGAGLSWEDVAASLGVSKQAAHKRFSPYVRLAVQQAATPADEEVAAPHP